MGKKFLLFAAVALVGILAVPGLAAANLINEYGMHYAGQTKCVGCHKGYDAQLHGRFATQGLQPGAPAGWTNFVAAGNVAQTAGTKGALYDTGGVYPIASTWITLGDLLGNSATEYLFWKGTNGDTATMPWNLVEGLVAEPDGEWTVGDDTAKGLYDVVYSCQRCHQLGTTMPGAGKSVPNPAAATQPSATTAVQWARDDTKSADDFTKDPAVSYPGMSIQCENCHGTGAAAAPGHMGSGVNVATDLQTLGASQVCGQCHGSFTNVAGTMGIYGYTPNQPLRNFVNVSGETTAAAGTDPAITYTTIPTVEQFMARPTLYWMFPNGSNAKGGHYYYDEWAASAHSYRSALAKDDPDAMAYQAAGNGRYSTKVMDPNLSGCYKCHTGEGFLKSKDATLAGKFTPTVDNVGKMGQECATCHNGHPTGVGADNVVRQPDKAGKRSATGLTVDNTSICEDCHNWQMEVMGASPKPAPMPTLEAHGNPSHPQREMLRGGANNQGKVMLDTASAGQFMPGAECEDCHMPKTNKTANRISHGMKPMLPGDAETWMTKAGAAYQGEDSCSSCHAGETRTELQTDIDKWQKDATDKAAVVAGAIKAATTKAGSKIKVATSPASILIGRATWNYKAFENDASEGVHNPTYIMAGLVKAEQMAKAVGGRFAHTGATAVVRKGRHAHVAGLVVNGNGSGATGATVSLLRGTKVIATTTTDSRGNFAFTLKAAKTFKTYRVKWARSSVAATSLFSARMTIKVK